ncbi:hypothetical protein KDX23_10215 [Burkholderia vietnamiensis]|uniref:hypothetical protein n=1 Tax=Burkholderia vietnamiensis TaxID=60552 RepID=UPI001BA20FDB|nr:hypothetical protein [Burkholderia vietnamiensis]MBR8083116.1 hypothetical protein [Burkholderia vietnamiensis]
MTSRARTISLCMNIDGFIRHARYPGGYKGLFVEDGKTLTPAEARTFLALEKAKGRIVIPCSSECGNPCKHTDNGCTGFDYSGGGCPGRFSGA